MFLQPGAYNVWNISNQQWASPFIWIPAVISLIFGLFLLVSYFNKPKKHILLWAFGFLGIWIFYHVMSGAGTYNMLLGSYDSGMFSIPVAMLLLLIPGLFAAGLCFDKDKKLGLYYTLYVVLMTALYMVLQLLPNGIESAETSKLVVTIAYVVVILVQLPSGALIIALPIMKEGRLFPKNLVSVAGGFMITANIIMSLLMFFVPTAMRPQDSTIELMVMFVPICLTISVLCLTLGIIGNKDWGFAFPHVEFEEKE
jgi:hypothetical protein